MKRLIIATTAVAGLVLGACSSDESTTATTATTAAGTETTEAGMADMADVTVNDEAAACAEGKTLEAGSLTLATGDPAYPPYVLDDAPDSGQGFESAIAMAVAKTMGFESSAVKWVRTSFDTAVAGSDTNFDFNLQQFSITDDRKEVVSFSNPYYTANQAVLGYTDGPASGVTTLSDLKGLKLGAAAGTTSLNFVLEVIEPDVEPMAFNSNADAKTALDNGQIEAIITDLPTGLYISAVEIEGTTVYGQFSVDAGGAGEQWGLLFVKENPLVECANLALAALTDSGAIEAITQQWMGDYLEAPLLGKD
jgi:polar amino acid transport system substrate-binding protein